MTDACLKRIKAALLAYDKKEEGYFDDIANNAAAPSAEFSAELDRRKESLLKNKNKTLSAGRIVAILAAAVIILSLTVLSISAVRGHVFNFFVEYFEDNIKISYNTLPKDDIPAEEEEPSTEESNTPEVEENTGPAIPPEYVSTLNNVDSKHVFRKWSNGDNEIVFSATLGSEGVIRINSEAQEVGKTTVKGLEAYYILNYGRYSIAWVDDEGSYMLKCPESFGLEMVVRIAESLTPVQA